MEASLRCVPVYFCNLLSKVHRKQSLGSEGKLQVLGVFCESGDHCHACAFLFHLTMVSVLTFCHTINEEQNTNQPARADIRKGPIFLVPQLYVFYCVSHSSALVPIWTAF